MPSCSRGRSGFSFFRLRSIVLGALAAAMAACAPAEPDRAELSLYALVQGIDGVYFYPPLGPDPAPSGTFDATLLDGISVVLEAEDAAGDVTPLATFDRSTEPRVALLAEQERYWVNIPAAAYVTDPSKRYRVRVQLDGNELGRSVLSAHIFEVLAWSPGLPLGVHVRVEGTGAVRAASRARLHGTPAHCTDGRRNKDETGVDCGGGCAPCATCTDGIQNQGELGIDCGGPCPVDVPDTIPAPASASFTGYYHYYFPTSGALSHCVWPPAAPWYWQYGGYSANGPQFASAEDACYAWLNTNTRVRYVSAVNYRTPTVNSWGAECVVTEVATGASRAWGLVWAIGTTCDLCPAGTTPVTTTGTVLPFAESCACPANTGWSAALNRCVPTCGR